MENYLANPNTYYVKQNVNHREYFMQKYVYQLDIVNVPEIIEYNDESKIMVMKKVGKHNLSDQYGENATDVPKELFDQVIKIVRTLVLHNIEYPDLTGYNFVEDSNGKIWIIDFGHAKCRGKDDTPDPFLLEFIEGKLSWNPEFK